MQMKTILAMLITVLLGVPSAWAMGGDAKQQEMFPKMKQIKVDGIQGRISVLQNALSCVNAATSHDQMRPCEEREHQAMEALQQQQKAKWEALKPQK